MKRSQVVFSLLSIVIYLSLRRSSARAGLKVMAEKFPQGMIVGTLPPSCRPAPPVKKTGGKPPAVVTQAVPAEVPLELGQLTQANLDLIREQLEIQLLADDGKWCIPRSCQQAAHRIQLATPPSGSQIHRKHSTEHSEVPSARNASPESEQHSHSQYRQAKIAEATGENRKATGCPCPLCEPPTSQLS